MNYKYSMQFLYNKKFYVSKDNDWKSIFKEYLSFYNTVMISVLINTLDITKSIFNMYLTLYSFHIYAYTSLKINHTKTCNEGFFYSQLYIHMCKL